MTTTRRFTLPLVAAFATVTLLSCTEARRAPTPAPAAEVLKTRQGLTSRFTENFESGLGAWTLTASPGSAWLGVNPSSVSVASALNPALVTLADTGAHLPAIGGGTQVAWFGSASTGTFIGSNYAPGDQSPKNGGSSASVQLGTMSSGSIALPAGEAAQLEFDSWWEIEGVAAASYDKMDVLISTNGGTSYAQLGRLNPSFAAPQPGDAAYSSGGPAQSPVWRRYVYNLTSYAGQTIRLQFMFDSGDNSYNAFRGFTVDNIAVGSGPTLLAPAISAVTPSVATANALVVIDGANYLQGAQFFIGPTQITAGNITQFGATSLIFRVPTMAAGTYSVRVRNPDAQEFTRPAAFTYVTTPAPGVTTIAPATGSAGVSQNVTITGTNFVSGAQVIIGGAAASSVTVVSATQITGSAPGVVAGTHNVVVRNPNGQEGVKYAAYTVTGAPPLTLTAPNGGESLAAGSAFTITWASSGVTAVNLELYKSGVFHSTIASNVPSSGSSSWTVPGSLTAAADYRVRIVSTASSANDTSNGNFTVTAPAGSVVTVTPTTNGTITCNSPVSTGGTLTCTITPSSGFFLSALTDTGSAVLGSVSSGQYIVTNVAAAKTITGTFSSAAPALISPSTGTATSDPTPTFSGSCVTGAAVSVLQGVTTLCSSPCVGSSFACTAPAQPEGALTVTARQADASGNAGATTTAITITIDTLAPAAPGFTTPGSGSVSTSVTPLVTGSCETGATVSVFEGATLRCAAACTASAFSCSSSSLSEGGHTFVARQNDSAANTSADATVSFSVDSIAPQAPSLSAPLPGASLPLATPNVAGTCETGAQVVVTEGPQTLCTTTCALGAFQCVSSALADGAHTVTAAQTDAAGNGSGTSSPVAFLIDTASPVAPGISAPSTNAVLSNAQPTLTGSCETSSTIQVLLGATVVCSTSCTAGSYACQVSALSEGPYTLGVVQTDLAGNVSPSASLALTIDLTAPSAPGLTAPAAGAFLATATPTLSGSCETGSQVEVLEGAAVRCSASCAGGTFSCPSSTLADGNHQVFARQTDAAGNTSASSALRAFVIDTQVAVATLSQPSQGTSLSTLTPTFGGACETGATVTVSAGAQVVCTVSCAASSYSCVSAPLPEGAQSVSVVQVDQAGNTSTASAPLPFTLDVTAPQAPGILSPAPSTPLSTATPQVSGTCETGSTVSVFEGASPKCSAPCVAGAFTCTSAASSDGAHLLLARQTDSAGNVSPDASVSFSIDTSAPQSVVLSAPFAGAVLPSATPRLAGSCESGAQVALFEEFETLCSATCVNDAFECNSSFRLDGSHGVVAVQTDSAGNASSPSAPVTFTVDTQTPAAPVVQAPAAGSTLGSEQPTISGSCETGATVQVMRGPGLLCTSSCLSSAFSCVTSALGEGAMSLLVHQLDAAGNQSPFVSLALTIDLTAPVAPALTSPLEGTFVATATPTLLGSCDSGAHVDVFEGATLLCSSPCAAGQFSCDAPTLSEGPHALVARQTDAAGNTGPSSSPLTFTVDSLIAPATFSLPAAGALLSTLTPTITGGCESDATVTVTSGATTACTTSCVAGTFSCLSAPLAEGPHTLELTQVDRAGNTGALTTRAVTLDSILPAAPTLTAPLAGSFLQATTVTIEGACEAGALVELFAGSTSLCSAVCADEKFSCTSPQQPEGLLSLTAQQRDAAGNVSASSMARDVTLDVTNPSLVVISSPLDGSATADSTPTLTGGCEPAATIQVRVGSALRCETTCSSSSTFSCTSALLADGPQVFDLVQRDRAGNQSATSTVTVTIDTTRPALGAVTQPAAGATLATVQPTLSGTGEPLGTVVVFANGVEVCRAPIDASGVWSCPSTLSEGWQALQVLVRDVQGNESSLSPAVGVRVDVTPPGVPSLLLPSAGQVVGVWPSFSGRGEPTSMVRVRVAGAEVCQARVDQEGAWSCLVQAALTPGLKLASASAIDDAGLTSATSDQVSFEVRTVARPSTPVLTRPLAGDVVTVSLPRFVGRAEPGSLVGVHRSSGELCNAVATSEGDFECTSTVSLPDGSHQVTSTATRGGQVSTASQPTAFIVDTRPMSSPQLLSPQANAMVGTRPAFLGSAGPRQTVAVSVDGAVVCSATADAQGRFACLSSTPLQAGARLATAVATDAAGQSSAPSAAVSFTVLDVATPSAPAIVTPADGTLLTNGSVVFAGLAQPGSRVQVSEAGQVMCEAEVSAVGDWTCTASVMSDGLHQVSARASTAAGVSAESSLVSVRVDRLGSPAPQLTSPSEAQMTNAWPRFAGTATAGERVIVRVDGREVCGASADPQGAFSCAVMAPLASGARVAVAVSVDASARSSAPSTAVRFIVSTREPRLLAPTAGAALSTKRPQLSGVVEPGSSIEAFIDGRRVCTASSLGDGTFSCAPTEDEGDGLKVAHVIADDGFGTKRSSAEVRFVLDTIAPAAPGLSAPARGERVLGDVVRFSGTAEPGTTVTVSVNGAPVCTAVVSSSGGWSCEARGLVDGQQSVNLSTVDVAGNRSDAATSAFVAAIALASPALQLPEAEAKVLGPEVEFSGIGIADTLVTVVDAKGAPLCTATVAADDTFRCTAALAVGPQAVAVRAEWMTARSVDSEPRVFTVMRQASIWGGGAGCSASGLGTGGLAVVVLLFARRRTARR